MPPQLPHQDRDAAGAFFADPYYARLFWAARALVILTLAGLSVVPILLAAFGEVNQRAGAWIMLGYVLVPAAGVILAFLAGLRREELYRAHPESPGAEASGSPGPRP